MIDEKIRDYVNNGYPRQLRNMNCKEEIISRNRAIISDFLYSYENYIEAIKEKEDVKIKSNH